MSEWFSEEELKFIALMVKELPATENRFKKLLGELYPKVIDKPFIIHVVPKTKKGLKKINFSSEFKKELKMTLNNESKELKISNSALNAEIEFFIKNEVKKQVESIYKRLDNLEASLKSFSGSRNMAKIINKEEFTKKLYQCYTKIDLNQNKGGMVPIPSIRNEMGIDIIEPDLFFQYLYELERNRVIDIQIASDRKGVPNPELGIDDKVRGLLYYVVWRK